MSSTLTVIIISLILLLLLLLNNINVNASSIGTYGVTRRDFPFVDPTRCRIPDYCGIAEEWNIKFGRVNMYLYNL